MTYYIINKRLRDSVKEDFFLGGGGRGEGISIFLERDKEVYLLFGQTKGQEGGCQKILLMWGGES